MLDYNIQNSRLSGWLAVVVLVICTFYTVQYIQRPYTGIVFAANQTGWDVQSVDCIGECTLQVGDSISQIAGISFADIATDRSLVLFDDYVAGDTVQLQVNRQGIPLTIEWIMPPVEAQWLVSQTIIILFFAPFLIMAVVMLRWAQPRDQQWWLLYLFFLGYALWIVTGVVSPTTIGYSSIVLHVLTWLLAPLLLQLHWQIPSNFRPLPNWVWPTLYAVASFLAILELLQLTSLSFFLLGILIPLLASFCLLALRIPKATATNRRSVKVMFLGLIVAATPGITWILMGLFTQPPSLSMTIISSVSLGAWPFFYWYGSYYKHIGHVEPQVQTVAISVVFVVIGANAMSILVTYAGVLLGWRDQVLQFNVLITAFLVVFSAVGYNGVRYWFVRYLFKEMAVEIDKAAAWLSQQLPHASDRDIVPTLTSLMKRLTLTQSLIHVNGIVIFDYGLESSQKLLPPTKPDWVYLELPFTVGQTEGAWLLGTKAGDDYYPHHEQKRLDSVAQQIGAMLEMRRLYQAQADDLHVERNTTLWNLTYNMAHTLRSPITIILYALQYIEHFSDDADYKDSVETAITTTKEMSKLVNEMLILVRPVEMSTIQLTDVVERTLHLVEMYATQNNVTLTTQINNPSLVVSGIESRLIIAIQNLLVNSVQAMPKGGLLTLTIWQAGEQALIEIADTGHGIKQKDIKQIFTPFYTTRPEGTGWGLSQSHAIVEQHNGRIEVESEVGQGTTFTISLPLINKVYIEELQKVHSYENIDY